MNIKQLKNVEWKILICTMLLIIIGLIALYSATINSDLEEFKKQIIWIIISIPILISVMAIDYKLIARFSIFFYIICIILLMAVLLTGRINGATSWFNLGPFSLQPGEFAKIAVVLFLSSIISNFKGDLAIEINKPINLLKVIGIILLPVALIALQPDYGTATAYIFAVIFMLYTAGINKKYIITAVLIVVILVPILYLFVLPEHAKARIDVYLNPESDPRGDGYNIIQSKIAIGAGGLLGLGILQGTQTQLGYLYPKTTDFIYSVIGEEFGFVMCALIVIIYVVLITKSINVAKNATDTLGSMIAIGLVRNIIISYFRKYWNDNRTFAYYRSSTSFYKLWRKFNDNRYDYNWVIT